MDKRRAETPMLAVHVPLEWAERLDRLVEKRRAKDPAYKRSDAMREAIRRELEREDVAA